MNKMQGDDPPYLQVGTAVSAKYKGAFCEAKVSNVVRNLKCKVAFKMGLGTATLGDEQIEGPLLRVGQHVQAKHPERKENVDAVITKIQDCSQYTVVFDDGDITTLRRTALCLKSGRHFNESETLDQLPLTHPEHFGNPVVGGRRGRRSRQLNREDSSEGEGEEENEPDLELYSEDIGKVVSVETSDKKRNKDNWFPGLIVTPSAQPTVRINVKDEFLIRSFKDGRYYTVPKKEVSEFNKELGSKVESTVLAEAVDKALKYLEKEELPVHWERSTLFNSQSHCDTDSDENFTDSSDDEPREEKDHFVAQLYKFMDDSNTPLNKSPMISNKDVDLYRLFRVVQKLGGYNRVTNQNKWRSVTIRLRFPNSQNTHNQVKSVYKKCLFSYESFYRTLGCTMLNPTRNAKKNRGRPLIREKDRATPVQSPKPEKEDEQENKKEDDEKLKGKKDINVKKEEEKPTKKKESLEASDTSSSSNSDVTDQSETQDSSGKESTSKSKKIVEIKGKKMKRTEKSKSVDRVEEQKKEEMSDSDKPQQTRSKSLSKKETSSSPESKDKTQPKLIKVKKEEEKKRGRKRLNPEEKLPTIEVVQEPIPSTSSSSSASTTVHSVNVGDKLKVYYGPTHESKVTYEAKVLEIDREQTGPIYLVHYTGWNTRYDEWIAPTRIAENLSATTKAKRMKQGSNASGKATTPKPSTKRGRGMSITGRSTVPETPRSSTPSSVTSNSSRTKSPATTSNRNVNRSTRQGDWNNRRLRRVSVQTDASMPSDSESDTSISEAESTKSKTPKGDDSETRFMKKSLLTKPKTDKRKDDDDTEREDEQTTKRPKKKRVSESKIDDSDEEPPVNPPKGRILDLNEIRSELKGINKVKLTSNSESAIEKDATSSDESTSTTDNKYTSPVEEVDKKEKPIEKSGSIATIAMTTTASLTSSSEDIYEFKEPEPFEFETRKTVDDKNKKRLVPRMLDDNDKSPKKKITKSPLKLEQPKEVVEEKKRFKRSPFKKTEELDVKEPSLNKVIDVKPKVEDPFDKLIESPSFVHVNKAGDKVTDLKKAVKNLTDDLLPSFRSVSEYNDTTSETSAATTSEPYFAANKQQQLLFAEPSFSKDLQEVKEERSEYCKIEEAKKDSDEDDHIRASIQRVIAQSSLTDDDGSSSSNDAALKQTECKPKVDIKIQKFEVEQKDKEPKVKEKEINNDNVVPSKQTSSTVFQAMTETQLLEPICTSQVPNKVEDTTKEINIKSGTKIADSILQRFNLIKNKIEIETKEEPVFVSIQEENKLDNHPSVSMESKPNPSEDDKSEMKPQTDIETNVNISCNTDVAMEVNPEKKRNQRKIVSKEFIDSDTDSDSEERLIIHSDDDTQADAFDDSKPIENENGAKPESKSEDERNFKIEEIKQAASPLKEDIVEMDSVKEDEPDSSHIHSLLCQETIPGSPAPCIVEPKPKIKSIAEMPFASAPGSSNKSLLTNESNNKPLKIERIPSPVIMHQVEMKRDNRESSTVLDNTPPTTPESTISNLSPRGDNGGLSPNHGDNESCKSTENEGNDYSSERRSSANKIQSYSEEDTLMNGEVGTSTKKTTRDELAASPCKKRRRSCKGTEDVPTKRGRKPNNRSRHNSDSDDTSEHSIQGNITNLVPSTTTGIDTRFSRSPRPSKYNFYVEFDPSLDSAQRIAVLQQKLQDLRKTYADVKAELATIERRRKKIRRREKEASKAAKQEVVCT